MGLGKLIVKFITALFGWLVGAQSTYNPQQWWNTVEAIHADTSLNATVKLQRVEALLIKFRLQQLPPDSVYAFFYHRLGLYEQDTLKAVSYYQRSLQINNAGNSNCSVAYTGKTYRNIANNYYWLHNNAAAIRYFDSAIAICRKYYDRRATEFFASCAQQCKIHLEEGNFKEVLVKADLASIYHNTSLFTGNEEELASTYVSAASAAKSLRQFRLAKIYLHQAEEWWTYERNPVSWADCKMVETDIAIDENNLQQAETFLLQADAKARQQKDTARMLYVWERQGYLYNRMNRYETALAAYRNQLALIGKAYFTDNDKVRLYNNLGVDYDKLHQPFQALEWFNKAFGVQLGPFAVGSVLQNPTLQQLVSRPGKSAAFSNLQNKAELLMRCYQQNHQVQYLKAAEQSFLLAEQLLTHMRRNQTEEESQLLWRSESRNFYQQALEMCYEKQDDILAYEYLEKSRAALLNNRLNELGAAATLPPALQQKEKVLSLSVFNCRQRLLQFQPNSQAYGAARQQYDDTLAMQQHFITNLERTHSAYYTYKYADAVAPLQKLQQHLLKNNQQWVQYFLSDTLFFSLYADGRQLRFSRQVVHSMEQLLPDFLNRCTAFQQQQSISYRRSMDSLSYKIYDTLLGKLPLRPGRLIISPDNTPVPFDALRIDSGLHRCMVTDFSITYAYSANFLLHQYQTKENAGGKFFLGMAPVQFPAALHLQPLQSSENALQQAGAIYPGAELLTRIAATRQAFFDRFPQYAIVNLYTHAQSAGAAEPQLFMADGAIQLSELQRIQNPVTQLVVLSACETNAGRLASGEGTFSIARGFAMAGIPSTVATLWKADEAATYFITNRFHYYLSVDSAKDVALRHAKLDFMQQDIENELPFYWANMTLTGSTESIKLYPENAGKKRYWLIMGFVTVLVVAGGYWWLKRRK